MLNDSLRHLDDEVIFYVWAFDILCVVVRLRCLWCVVVVEEKESKEKRSHSKKITKIFRGSTLAGH